MVSSCPKEVKEAKRGQIRSDEVKKYLVDVITCCHLVCCVSHLFGTDENVLKPFRSCSCLHKHVISLSRPIKWSPGPDTLLEGLDQVVTIRDKGSYTLVPSSGIVVSPGDT